MLSLGQQRPLIRRELSRRIGYTNGLHDIFRFARVVSYLHALGPVSLVSLRTTILEEEKQSVRGPKYADGVIDSARALALIHKIGANFTLADKGYALHAVQQLTNRGGSMKALLLNVVLESDGDATLNLLDLLANQTASDSIGLLLIERLLGIIELRERWATQNILVKPVRDAVLQDLSDAKKRLELAVDTDRKQIRSWSAYQEEHGLSAEQRVRRFCDHTVNPRRGWLKDLGCIEIQSRGQFKVTDIGYRLLESFKTASCYAESTIALPFSNEVLHLLGLPACRDSENQLWQATASLFGGQASPAYISSSSLFDFVESIYPHVKLHVFNEAATESIFVAISAQLATAGQYLDRQWFEDQLDVVSHEFSDRIYRLRQRSGGSGYIALRNNFSSSANDDRR